MDTHTRIEARIQVIIHSRCTPAVARIARVDRNVGRYNKLNFAEWFITAGWQASQLCVRLPSIFAPLYTYFCLFLFAVPMTKLFYDLFISRGDWEQVDVWCEDARASLDCVWLRVFMLDLRNENILRLYVWEWEGFLWGFGIKFLSAIRLSE